MANGALGGKLIGAGGGGFLMFYAAEAVRGRPLPPRALDYGYRIGFAIIGSLFIFISWNDLVHTGAVHWVTHLIG